VGVRVIDDLRQKTNSPPNQLTRRADVLDRHGMRPRR
jgi:hypothetical protein